MLQHKLTDGDGSSCHCKIVVVGGTNGKSLKGKKQTGNIYFSGKQVSNMECNEKHNIIRTTLRNDLSSNMGMLKILEQSKAAFGKISSNHISSVLQ